MSISKRNDQIEQARAKLADMPAHMNPELRACVVVAWMRSGRETTPKIFLRYHAEPVGRMCVVEGAERAMVVADSEYRTLAVVL